MPSGDISEQLKGFNLGAFGLFWVWAFAHRLYLWGILGLLFWIMPIIGIIPGFAIALYLGIKGNRLAWESKTYQNLPQFKDAQRTWSIVGGVILGLRILVFVPMVSIMAAVAIPNFLVARSKSNFTAAVQQMKNVASGMEQEISEAGSLANVKNEDDICHHVLPGYDKAADCAGQIKARVDEIAVPGSFVVTTDNNFQYEIKAQANDRSQCKICVTESAVRPTRYDPVGACAAYDCVH